MPERERKQQAQVVAIELASQVELEVLRGKLADPTIAPGLLFRYGDAVWEQQARALLGRFAGGDVTALHDDFLAAFVGALQRRLASPAPAG